MSPDARSAIAAVENAIHLVLKPMGFTRKRLDWRRQTAEVLQQFTLQRHKYTASYTPVWGLNLLSRRAGIVPHSYELDVRWGVDAVGIDRERLSLLSALSFDAHELSSKEQIEMAVTSWGSSIDLEELRILTKPRTDPERAQLVSALLRKYVVPCFEAFTTEAAVVGMARNPHHPLSTELLSGIWDISGVMEARRGLSYTQWETAQMNEPGNRPMAGPKKWTRRPDAGGPGTGR